MDNLPEWAGEQDEASEFDLANSAENGDDEDPEVAQERKNGAVPEEADAADAAEQSREVPADEDDGPHAD